MIIQELLYLFLPNLSKLIDAMSEFGSIVKCRLKRGFVLPFPYVTKNANK